MQILVLEDEIPAYNKLVSYLNEIFNDEVKHDWARSISEGKNFLLKEKIQLLDGISFDLFEETSINTPIIFCSAHDEYLFKAFNTNGIAYILKPYTKSDFNKAIKKYQTLFKTGDYANLNKKTITQLKSVLNEESVNFKKRFVIKKSNGIQLLNVIDISIIEASGDFCIATDFKGKRYAISQNLRSISKQLNNEKFFRINRSEIIHIDYIKHIENHFKNRLLITIEGNKEKVMTSSSTTANFRKWLEN